MRGDKCSSDDEHHTSETAPYVEMHVASSCFLATATGQQMLAWLYVSRSMSILQILERFEKLAFAISPRCLSFLGVPCRLSSVVVRRRSTVFLRKAGTKSAIHDHHLVVLSVVADFLYRHFGRHDESTREGGVRDDGGRAVRRNTLRHFAHHPGDLARMVYNAVGCTPAFMVAAAGSIPVFSTCPFFRAGSALEREC